MSAIIIFFILSIFIYIETKEKAFKYYALYNFFLLLYIITKSVYLEDVHIFYKESRWLSLNWLTQITYNCMMILFYFHLLDLKKHFKKPTLIYTKFIYINLVFTGILFIYSVISKSNFIIQSYFLYFFTPVFTLTSLYFLRYLYKLNTVLSKLIIFGVILYTSFAITALYKTLIRDFTIAPITYFLIGVFFESIIFMSALAFKVKEIYIEKILAQQLIIKEKEKINLLKENYQKELETKLDKQEKLLRKTLEKSEYERIELLKSEYENDILNLKLNALRSQMNPHFLFNALNSIKVYFIENNKEQAVYYLNKFSKLIRNILEFSKREYITVKEELEVVELYLSIENIRFNNEINIIFDDCKDNQIAEKRIPGLILQPFVENSIWHGLMLKKGEKSIQIGCEKINSRTGIYILDNGIGRTKAAEMKVNSFKKESLGIAFSYERLKSFNKQHKLNYEIEIIDLIDEQNQSTGTKVIFWLE